MRENGLEGIEVDTMVLRAALAETAAALIEIKRQLRRSWTRPMASEQRALAALKEKATLLCILRAYLRGRHHLRRPPRRGYSPGSGWDPVAYHRDAAERAVHRFRLQASAAQVSP
jgi:hypothetical protein